METRDPFGATSEVVRSRILPTDRGSALRACPRGVELPVGGEKLRVLDKGARGRIGLQSQPCAEHRRGLAEAAVCAQGAAVVVAALPVQGLVTAQDGAGREHGAQVATRRRGPRLSPQGFRIGGEKRLGCRLVHLPVEAALRAVVTLDVEQPPPAHQAAPSAGMRIRRQARTAPA